MSLKRVQLDDIVFDGGTQVREAISEEVVGRYADLMSDGIEFPPVTLFHDGNRYYLADGFHRALASRRLGKERIHAEVQAGTRQDALWCALGANRTNGLQLNRKDLDHAIELAVRAWPDRSARDIAIQLGCSNSTVSSIKKAMQVCDAAHLPERVVGKDDKSYPSSRTDSRTPAPERKREAVAGMVRDGKSYDDIRSRLGVSPNTITQVKKDLGLGPKLDRSAAGTLQRRDVIRQLASEGHTTEQIAAKVGVSEEGLRAMVKKVGIAVPADMSRRRRRRVDTTRVIETMVMDAENLTADVSLIDFDAIDPGRLPEWIKSLNQSREKLGQFIRRLTKEQQKHGEAA